MLVKIKLVLVVLLFTISPVIFEFLISFFNCELSWSAMNLGAVLGILWFSSSIIGTIFLMRKIANKRPIYCELDRLATFILFLVVVGIGMVCTNVNAAPVYLYGAVLALLIEEIYIFPRRRRKMFRELREERYRRNKLHNRLK